MSVVATLWRRTKLVTLDKCGRVMTVEVGRASTDAAVMVRAQKTDSVDVSNLGWVTAARRAHVPTHVTGTASVM